MEDLNHRRSVEPSSSARCKEANLPGHHRNAPGLPQQVDYDPDSELFMLGGLLPEGMMFPFDFGFIPSTLGEDGDPLDILVLMDAPAHVGCLIEVRIIGIIEAEQSENGKTETNDRLLGVAIHSYQHEDVESLGDLGKTLL